MKNKNQTYLQNLLPFGCRPKGNQKPRIAKPEGLKYIQKRYFNFIMNLIYIFLTLVEKFHTTDFTLLAYLPDNEN